MEKIACRVTWTALILLLAPLVLPGNASAQYREFSGSVAGISEQSMRVDNGKGDELSFVKISNTVVSGKKQQWQQIEKNDWVSVSWMMMDEPRAAHRVVVMSPKKAAGTK